MTASRRALAEFNEPWEPRGFPMRVLLSALILGLTACAGTEDASPASVKRQAVGDFTGSGGDGGPQVKGTLPFAHLGAVAVACPDGGYAAGAPGDDSVWLSPARLRIDPPRSPLTEVIPYPLACVGSG